MTPSLILVALSALQITPTLKPTPPATLVSMGQRRLAQSEIEPARAQYITGPSGGTVYTVSAQERGPWYEPWLWWGKLAALALGVLVAIPRTRPHVLGFLYSVAHAHPLAALAKAGATLGVVHSATADTALTAARKRRGKVPPAVVVSTEQKPHA